MGVLLDAVPLEEWREIVSATVAAAKAGDANGTRLAGAILVGKPGIFACRHCRQLAYASSREDAGGRATRRADRLRARLGWEPGILNGEGGKPKWMRWRTFERLATEHDHFVGESLAVMALRFGIKF